MATQLVMKKGKQATIWC